MNSNSTAAGLIHPDPTDWLNSDRNRYLYECIYPLSPLLLESNLLDKLLLAWFRHEIIHEINHGETLRLDDQSCLLKWCRQHWGHRLESLYLDSKNKLDLISYRVLNVDRLNLAHELYYRLKANEATFDQLCMRYSMSSEKFNIGTFTDVSLSSFPPLMQSAFTSMQVGDLHKPVKNGQTFAVVQLLKYILHYYKLFPFLY